MATLMGLEGVGLSAIAEEACCRDAALVRRCRSGDEAAWTALVERFADYVYAILVRGFELDDATAQDAFQEVFTRVFRRLDSLEDASAIKPWIAQVSRRVAVDQRRATHAGADIEALMDAGGHDPAFELIDRGETVRQALAGLPEPYRDVIERFFIRDQSYQTIAAELGLASGTIASRISRGLSMLRTMLEEPVVAVHD